MASLDWVKQIEETVLSHEQKPQFGIHFEFPWEGFEKHLQKTFEIPVTLIHQAKGWTNSEKLLEGIGRNQKIAPIQLTPLQTPVFFVTTDQDVRQLMSTLLGGEETASFFYDNNAAGAFFDYFIVEILRLLDQMQVAKPLAFRLGEVYSSLKESALDEPCFLVDLSLEFEGTFFGRILLPESFRNEWKEYFSQVPPLPPSPEVLEKVPLEVSLEIGRSGLTLGEWKNAKQGDFLLLDHCSFNPETNKGSILLTVDKKPLFRARIKEGEIKITDYPKYEEVSGMERDIEDEDEEDLYGDKDLDDDFFKEFPEKQRAEPREGEKGMLDPDEIPIQLTVEIGRLKMSAKNLMDLAPGNVLDLHVSPEQGVDLIVNGKKVGRGELIRLGEVLGVRILSL